jgi:acyl-CoA oxidase
MFVPAIKGQGTEEQQKKWLPMAYKFQIIGCYAQTELGHGSNVQGLETTATFDPNTDEFIMHSPTLTSSKVISCNLLYLFISLFQDLAFLAIFPW